MIRSKDYRIVANTDFLDEDYIPNRTPGREEQIEQMKLCIEPLARRERPINMWLYGPVGTGKTLISKLILRNFCSRHKIYGVYVNCWERATLFSILEKIIMDLRMLEIQKPDTGYRLQELNRRLKGASLLLILDEIDKSSPKERDSIIYNLCSLENTCLICISNSRSTLFSLDERNVSRLNPRQIEFMPYTQEDIEEMLKFRAEMGLAPGTWDRRVIQRIAEMSAGDARIAIKTLNNSAYYADREGNGLIRIEHANRAWNDAKVDKRAYMLDKLTPDHRVLYEIVRSQKHILSNELWRAYVTSSRKMNIRPIALRTYCEYVNRLKELGLINAERARIRGRVRVFSPAITA